MTTELLKGLEVLVVDSDPNVVNGLKKLLAEDGFVVTGVQDIGQAQKWLTEKFFAVVLCDLDTPGPNEGLRVVHAVRELSPATAVIVMSPRRAYDSAVAAFRVHADDVVVKSPEQVGYLRQRVKEAAQEHRLSADKDELFESISTAHEDFLKRMMDMFKQVIDLHDRLQGREEDVSLDLPECRVLVVDPDPALAQALIGGLGQGWAVTYCQSGGEALDHAGRQTYHIVLVHQELPDLPVTMVTRTVKSQSSESIVLTFTSPGDPPGKVQIVESAGYIPVIPEYREQQQIFSSLDTLREAFRAKARERRYLQAFRAQHFDFLKRYAEIKNKIVEIRDRRTGRL